HMSAPYWATHCSRVPKCGDSFEALASAWVCAVWQVSLGTPACTHWSTVANVWREVAGELSSHAVSSRGARPIRTSDAQVERFMLLSFLGSGNRQIGVSDVDAQRKDDIEAIRAVILCGHEQVFEPSWQSLDLPLVEHRVMRHGEVGRVTRWVGDAFVVGDGRCPGVGGAITPDALVGLSVERQLRFAEIGSRLDPLTERVGTRRIDGVGEHEQLDFVDLACGRLHLVPGIVLDVPAI